jgi:hypothetical protein
MFLLSLYGVRRLSRDVSADAGFLCDKPAGLDAVIEETPCKTGLSVYVCCKMETNSLWKV